MTEIEIYKQIVQKQDELIKYLLTQWKDSKGNENYTYESERLKYYILSLRRQLEKFDQCKNILEKVKEANTPDKRTFEEAEADKAYLNECIAKAEPNLSKIKDVDKELAEIRGHGWICPRCGKVHSWLSMTCDCEPKTITATTH